MKSKEELVLNYMEAFLKTITDAELQGMLSRDEWEKAISTIEETGKIPDEYAGRITEVETSKGYKIVKGNHAPGVQTGERIKVYYDTAVLEVLRAHAAELEQLYEDILKAENESNHDIAAIEAAASSERSPASWHLPAIGSVPSGEALNVLFRAITSSKNGRVMHQSSRNRHEKVTVIEDKKKTRIIRENKKAGSSIVVEIDQADKYLGKTGKTFSKILTFTLQQMAMQNFPPEVGFSLQELVDQRMYNNTNNAARAVKDFFAQQKQTTLSGVVKIGKKTIKEEGGVLFYHYNISNGFVRLSVNENFNMEFIASYFTAFPSFAYALSYNAFSLVRYIFFLARQNTRAIKEKGTFTISLDAVRENLGLPSVEEVNNRRYRQLIINPIENAIEEIEEALLNVPEAKDCGFTITPYTEDTGGIYMWLQGYLEIGLKGDFAKTFVHIAETTERKRKNWERVKQSELAKIAARKEAKAAEKTT